MAWEHLSITKPHLVYIILGGFTTLFMLCSSIIKERMYIGEATVATLCGLIFGPHAADLIDPQTWGSVDIVTIEFSRVVLVVQCFAVGVELPKFYMERHWKSVVFLLVPVMTYGWLVTSLFVWWMVPPLNWLESLVVAACVTATDPVLASSVVGKGKFARKVPKHLRDLLSAESGCNDGMAFPFIYLSLYLIQDHQSASKVTFHWLVYTVLYECIFGAIYGFLIGYIARHGIKYAEKHDLIDRESFLVFYFVLALFCAGSGSILGVDDLLVGFACGVGFSNDGWFGDKTEESHVSNVIDLLLNLAYFVYLGTIIPWEMFNNADIGLSAWKLTVIAIFVILFRRIPIMMALKPLIPDIKTWREALFAGHFGPIGVGAIFVAILARAELESDNPVPLSELPPPDVEHYTLITLVWPITAFLVVASILIHGSSIAVFTLGKHINTLTLTMSYTTALEEGPTWMNRLPRISSQSRSQAKSLSDTEGEEPKMPDLPPGALPPVGLRGQFLLRRQKDEERPSRQNSRASSLVGRRRKKKHHKWDDGIGPGGPISQSAIAPQRRTQSDLASVTIQGESTGHTPPERADTGLTLQSAPDAIRDPERADSFDDVSPGGVSPGTRGGADQPRPRRGRGEVEADVEVYDEGDNIIVENEQGDVLDVEPVPSADSKQGMEELASKLKSHSLSEKSVWSYDSIKKRLGDWKHEEMEKRKNKEKETRKHEPARVYQFGNTIIVEDEDGEVVKKYELPSENAGGDLVSQSLKYMGMGGRVKPADKAEEDEQAPADSETGGRKRSEAGPSKAGMPSWLGMGFLGTPGEQPSRQRKKSVAEVEEEEDDRQIRFTMGGANQRLTKDAFIEEMKKLDKSKRAEVVDQSSASHVIKTLAKQDPAESPDTPPGRSGKAKASVSGRGRRREEEEEEKEEEEEDKEAGPGGTTRSSRSSSSISREQSPGRGRATMARSPDAPETAVERRRRLAVLSGVEDDEEGEDETKETPAERRRREAALGPAAEEDSDDDNTPRVPPAARRGIRFAEQPERRS